MSEYLRLAGSLWFIEVQLVHRLCQCSGCERRRVSSGENCSFIPFLYSYIYTPPGVHTYAPTLRGWDQVAVCLPGRRQNAWTSSTYCVWSRLVNETEDKWRCRGIRWTTNFQSPRGYANETAALLRQWQSQLWIWINLLPSMKLS